MSKKRCIVTGASGLLGREALAVLSSSFDVLGLGYEHAGGRLRSVDIRDTALLRNVVDEVQPDVVVHCAAYRDPDFCEEEREETWRLNVEPVRFLCRELPACVRLVFISSDYVFSGDEPPYSEGDVPQPINAYGASKVAAEEHVLARADGLVLRIPLLMGSGADGSATGFIAQLVDAVRSGDPIELDDVLVRFPTWTRDVAHAVEVLLKREAKGVYHMSGARGGTRYGWTLETATLMGARVDHVTRSSVVVPRQAARPRDSQLATEKIRTLGFGRFTDFADVVKDVLGLR